MPRWKAAHPRYWKSEHQREYLRRWRREHPDYFKKKNRQKRRKRKEA